MASPWSPREEGELLLALDEIEANPAARVVILTGAGGHFCAGGDVTNMRQRSTAADGQVRVGLLNRAVLRLVNFPLPTIAMVDGYAVGAGSNLALCCDLIVATERAQFGELFCKIGLAVDGGGTCSCRGWSARRAPRSWSSPATSSTLARRCGSAWSTGWCASRIWPRRPPSSLRRSPRARRWRCGSTSRR